MLWLIYIYIYWNGHDQSPDQSWKSVSWEKCGKNQNFGSSPGTKSDVENGLYMGFFYGSFPVDFTRVLNQIF